MKDYFIEQNLYLKFMSNDDPIIKDYIIKIHKHHNTIDTITQIENVCDFKINDNSLFWTIVYEDRIIGFFNFIKREQPIDNTLELQRFYIDEEYRYLNIGSKVMSKIKEVAKDMNYSGLSLKVYCNNPAINFYNKNGFDTYYRYMYTKL
ncbi:GNAT family N-acetyltransferase [Clostridium perfringens]|uniref:Acetyltransferase, gnat family n=1 Tax=Clostridium perfringens E str. JGS1987 TaxID=451755 RepID=B1BVE6_CLOPF|nr:GNAT family N-acetyltransferase [Clostridium perfringens]EDT14294.1 acetyltransferase, gnat family [Clostridium perfringens E str. JGS1987]